MKIILTEKPSVAKDFAKALNCRPQNGYYEGDNLKIVNCIGHLIELCYPEDYDAKYKKWRVEDLPILPVEFKYKANPKTKKQLKIIKEVLNDGYEKILIATDAGREGELIARLTLSFLGVKNFSNVFRFWESSALTEEVIKNGLKNAMHSREYDQLFLSGDVRQKSDWLMGINLSRALTLKISSGDVFSFGRVQTSVLSLVTKRTKQNNAFEKIPYYELEGVFDIDNISLKATHYKFENEKDTRFSTIEEVQKIEDEIKETKAKVVKITKESKTKKPPALHSLTSLQQKSNESFGYSAQKTLDVAQSLYEKHKCLSYPRTPSRVLGESDVNFLSGIFKKMKEGYPEVFQDSSKIKKENKELFDNEKLEDHHALIPLALPPSSLSEEEQNIFNLVLISFAQILRDNYVYESIKIYIESENKKRFLGKGKNVLRLGWTEVKREEEEKKEEDQEVSGIKEGQVFQNIKTLIMSKETLPPKLFTESTILKAMENPERLSEKEERDYHFNKGEGIGTPATRASILETLLKRGYIERKKRKLLTTEKGVFLINFISSLPKLKNITDVSETARWEKSLKEDPERFLNETVSTLTLITKEIKESLTKESYIGKREDIIGPCPKCKKGTIRAGKKSYYCTEYKEGCKFTLWKEAFFTKIPLSEIKNLVEGKPTKKMKLKKKDGGEFQASLILDKENKITFAPRKIKRN